MRWATAFSLVALCAIIGCSERVITNDFNLPADEARLIPDPSVIMQQGYKREIRSPSQRVESEMPKILASSSMILGETPSHTMLVSEIGTIRYKGRALFAEFPMVLLVAPRDSQSSTIYAMPIATHSTVTDQSYVSSYKNRQEYFARRTMYRIAMEIEGKKRWSWLFKTDEAQSREAK
jgi:hypothetical protein